MINIVEKVSLFINEKVDEKSRNAALAGLIVLILIVDYFAIMMWQIKAFSTINPQISTLSVDLKTAKENIKNLTQYQAQVNQLTIKAKTAGAAILSKEAIPGALDSIASLAKEFHVKINQISPLKESQKLALSDDNGKYFSLPISVTAKGAYHNLGQFFQALEQNGIFIHLTDFNITASGDDPLRHQAVMTMKVFVREDKEEAIAVP